MHGCKSKRYPRSRAAAGNLGSALHLPFFRMLKENVTREERYQQMIDHLSSNIADGIEDIQNRLDAFMTTSKTDSTTK